MSEINTIEINGESYTIKDSETANLVQALINTKSHIGMIIQSTTLDTMEKVIEQYGG